MATDNMDMNQRTQLAAPITRNTTRGGGQILPGADYAGINYAGYTPSFDPQSQSQLPGYEKYLDQNSGGYNKFSQEAQRHGPSSWAGLAGQQQDMLAQNALERGGRQSSAATAGAMGNLASQGGLSSGARERLQTSGAQNLMNMSQDLARQNNLNKMNIGVQDEQNRISQLSSLPGMEQARMNAWQGVRGGDLQNQINQGREMNDYNQRLAALQMQGVASRQQANATANSGSKGGFMDWLTG